MTQMTPPGDPKLKPERIDTYRNWQAQQKIPVVRGFFVEDVNKVAVEPWDLKGVPCSFIVLDGTGGTNDAYVCEIPPGSKTKPQKHLYEEMVYVAKGDGATTVWQRDAKKSIPSSGAPAACSLFPSTPTTSTSMPAAASRHAILPLPTAAS